LEGTDYFLFNAIDIAASNSGIEYGFLTHKPSGTNGSKNVTISNCVVTMTKGISAFVAGIYIGNGTTSESSSTGVAVTSADGTNSNIYITGNTIQNVHSGILSIGSAPATFYDTDIIVGQSGSGNVIQNFGGTASGPAHGVYFLNANNPSVSFNTINNAGGGGASHTDSLFGIRFQIVSGNITANNNAFTVNNTSTRLTSVIHNSNNTVVSETYNNNTFTGILSTGSLNLIYTFSNNTPDKTASGNVVAGITKSGGGFNGYYSASSLVAGGTESITNNNFSNITITGGSGTVSGIYGASNTSHNFIISNNIISNITFNGSGTINAITISGGANVTQINNNNIFNITSGATLYGINFTGLNAAAYNNNIYGITSTTTGFNVVYGITTGTINNNTTNYYIYNNYISDLKAPGSKSFLGTAGINAGAGTNVNLFYNTIYLKFTSTEPTNRSAAIGVGDTGPNVDMRDNIFINDADVTVGQTACAISKSGEWLLNISANTNNNLYYAGVPSSKHLIFYDGINSDSTLTQYKNRVSPRESNSVTELPPFINSVAAPYDLHINPLVATQLESGGLPVTSPVAVTTDYDGNTRNGSSPDIGADEFSGIPADKVSPIIVYSPLLNTNSTAARTLNVSVTDPGSGVPSTAPGWPNLYWKKNSGLWTAVTPSGIAGSVYTYNFGSGAAVNDTIYYYIVAQDNALPPNVGTYPSAGSGGFTSNPPAASVPPSFPHRYIITSAPLSGNYNVGTGGNYLSITDAVADLNLRGVSAPVNFLLTDEVYVLETFPIVIRVANINKPMAGNQITIKPNTGILPTIQGAPAQSYIIHILENYVVIDGSNSGGNDRSLTVRNTANDHPNGIWIGSTGTTPISGATVKNCNIINGANYSSPNYSVMISDGENAGIAGYFNNITIQNNSIQKSWDAIYCKAAVSAGNGSGLVIANNIINTSGVNAVHDMGIYLAGVDGGVISGNQVANLGGADAGSATCIFVGPGTINTSVINNVLGPLTGTDGVPRGISVATGVTNSNITISGNEISNLTASFGSALTALYVYSSTTGVVIENNKIHDIINEAFFGFGARGIIINTNIPSSGITIKNNMLWNISCSAKQYSANWGVGIGIDGTTGGIKVYHNSVNLYGSVATDSAGITTAFGVLSPTVTSLDVRDNIFVNKFENTLGITDKNYAINSLAPASAFFNINYNDYYVEGVAGILGYLGSDRTTLTAWQSATGQDINSISGNPAFISNSNLHINPDSSCVSNNGVYLSDVATDIDGNIRNNPPDLGADEYDIAASTFPLTVNVSNGWNMVSIPGLHPVNQNVITWWPGKDPG
jgi:hypothetical protein